MFYTAKKKISNVICSEEIIILCFEDSWDRGVRIFVLCSFSALLSKVCVAGRLGDAKITSQDEYKALAYSSGHVEFHRLSPDDSAQCLDSGHCSRESWCWIWQSPTKATQALLTPAPCSTPFIPLWVTHDKHQLKTPSLIHSLYKSANN